MKKNKDELRKLRSQQMKEINKMRRIETEAVVGTISFLISLRNPKKAEEIFGFQHVELFKHEINSYRANKIALVLNKRINKQKLLMYARSKDHKYKLTSKQFDDLLKINEEAIKKLNIATKKAILKKYNKEN